MNHSFNVEVAKEVGVLAATIFNNIGFWVDHNRANGRNHHDGRYWTYNSVHAFSEQFPYATEAQIAGALKKLREAGYLDTGNYCEDKRDRSLWYTLSERGWVTFYGSAIDPQEECISQNKEVHSTNRDNDYIDTDVNADAKPDTEQFKEILAYLNERTGRNYRIGKNVRKLMRARFNEGYTADDFKRVIDNMCKRWKGTKWEQYLQPSTLFAPSHFDEHLNKPETDTQPTGRLSDYDFAGRQDTITIDGSDDAYDWSGYDGIRF
jgi:uncharacterized phage protein (TIGR02220 family)